VPEKFRVDHHFQAQLKVWFPEVDVLSYLVVGLGKCSVLCVSVSYVFIRSSTPFIYTNTLLLHSFHSFIVFLWFGVKFWKVTRQLQGKGKKRGMYTFTVATPSCTTVTTTSLTHNIFKFYNFFLRSAVQREAQCCWTLPRRCWCSAC
jgi:hypothetical protein